MNRLTAYWNAKKLANLHLMAAEEAAAKDKEMTFKHNIIGAVRELMTAQNCLTSLAFNKKPKAKKR